MSITAAIAGRVVFIGPGASGATRSAVVQELGSIDRQDGGSGRIVGTVKEKNMPTNTPLRRRVILLNHIDKRVIRETWSDQTTGVYAFIGIAMGRKYDVISYDHTGAYRGVVADNLTPELMT